ncbi:cobyrinate a,c-diamide synthase [Maribius pontilimi]|uniref:Hydrogenobyrinate a,c-diamide synthase n=1 Tax=Palleronia pontilimi TaxID=1964209 RepID=A0A934IAI2_9RHOB|nr:cobyrinate a,c-diamide synthase [Palleronia pontilimi]MBJ3763509.1 cobyrinate a,c-diamide synthase [Palleronia pontilimi]
MTARGLIVAAPASGSGKTTVTLGILRALKRRGLKVSGAKSGPDYIDPRFHEAACGQPSVNLDAWAMSDTRIRSLAAADGLLVVEGAMGLFDGAPPTGRGATADLARILGLPVVLVVDAGRMAQSVAPLVAGFAQHDPSVRIAGVILNRVGSDRHERMLRAALSAKGLPVLGALPRDTGLSLPSRHLGLVQAGEHAELDAFLDHAADQVERHVDLAALHALAGALGTGNAELPNLPRDMVGTRIAIARDAAFSFVYPHQVADWQRSGARLCYFSPLADDPVPEADMIFLPGGYPELHAHRIASADRFLGSLRAASRTTEIYGECGGYMVLGETLTDADGTHHRMAGLLHLETSFAERKLTLGYRTLTALAGPRAERRFMAHEFHYATTRRAEGTPLFHARDAEGAELPDMGLVSGRVSGSFAHLIDSAIASGDAADHAGRASPHALRPVSQRP